MATNSINTRQYPLAAVVDVSGGGFGDSFTIKLPPNALMTSNIMASTLTAIVGPATATLTVTDGTTAFVNGVDVKSGGVETATGAGAFFPNGATLTGSFALGAGDLTAGRVQVVVNYVILDRVSEVYG